MKHYIVDPVRAALSLLAAVIFLTVAVMAAQEAKYIRAVLFAVLGVVYILQLRENLQTAVIGPEGVSFYDLGRCIRSLRWEDVRETGVLNLKVTNNYDKDRIGTMMLYVSGRELSDEEKLGICLRWPPRDLIYFRFTRSRYLTLQQYRGDNIPLFYLKEDKFLDKYFSQDRGFIIRTTKNLFSGKHKEH